MGIGGGSQASLGMAGVLGSDSPPRLKASPNNANGGVGITYSNVVLAGPGASGQNMTTLQAMQGGERTPNAFAKYHCVRPSKTGGSGGTLRQAASQVLIK